LKRSKGPVFCFDAFFDANRKRSGAILESSGQSIDGATIRNMILGEVKDPISRRRIAEA